MPARVLNSIFGINSPGLFDQLDNKLSSDVVISAKSLNLSNSSSTSENDTSNPNTLNLGNTSPQIQTLGGTAALGSAPYFPILAGLSVFLINLNPSGIIEPHTHPNAGELNYVINGKVRFTVFSPNGKVETGEISKGQVFFVQSLIFFLNIF